MSQAEKFMDLLKEGVQRMGSEIGAEIQHQVGRGASESANLLFTGQAFVLYGHGSSQPDNANQLGNEGPSPEVQAPEMTQSRGMSM